MFLRAAQRLTVVAAVREQRRGWRCPVRGGRDPVEVVTDWEHLLEPRAPVVRLGPGASGNDGQA